MAGDADHAVLAQQDLDATEAAGVVLHLGVDLRHGVEHGQDRGDAGVGGGGAAEIEAGLRRVGIVAQVDGDVAGHGVDVDLRLQWDAVGEVGEGVEGRLRVQAAGRELAHGGRGDPLGVVEPLTHEGLDRRQAELGAELFEPLLADARRGDHGEVVAIPDLGDADALLAHADDVPNVSVVLLDLDAGKDEGALRVDINRLGHIGGRERVADVPPGAPSHRS